MAKFIGSDLQSDNWGEDYLIKKLKEYFDDSYVIYRNRPIFGAQFDVCLLAPKIGIIIFEVKSWRLDTIKEVKNGDSILIKTKDAETGEEEEAEEPFKISDLGKVLSSGGFWLVALLCVLYYSAIFPFQKYAVNMLQCNISFEAVPEGSFWASNNVALVQYVVMLLIAITAFTSNFSKGIKKTVLMLLSVVSLLVFCYMSYRRQSAESIFAVFPLLAVGITPILGKYVDNKGKAASMLMLGSILLIVCHLTFAFVLPQFKSSPLGGVVLAFSTILVLGASFSLVPASLWPSVPKLVDSKVIGSAYALIFWIQNIGLWLFPLLIGKILKASNPEIEEAIKNGTMTPEKAAISYDYTNPLLMLALLGAAALVLGILLKAVDKKKHLGLEEPNIKA
mgnify:CR=1 FL=1